MEFKAFSDVCTNDLEVLYVEAFNIFATDFRGGISFYLCIHYPGLENWGK